MREHNCGRAYGVDGSIAEVEMSYIWGGKTRSGKGVTTITSDVQTGEVRCIECFDIW
jgi:hypothetical protein